MKQLKIGIIGAGRIGSLHAKSITYNVPTATVVGITDVFKANAEKVAEFLSNHKKVEWVKYASLKDNPYYELGKKYMPRGLGGMLSFGVRGGAEKASQVMEAMQMIAIVTHVADVRSCVLHPASTTHRQLSSAELESIGIADNLIRLSVGIENVDDIIADLEQALDKI